MKNWFATVCIIFICSNLCVKAGAQNVPDGTTGPITANSANIALPANYNTALNYVPVPLYNYTRSWAPRCPIDDTTNVFSMTSAYIRRNTTYTNGWGQSLQSITTNSPYSLNDVITFADLRQLSNKPSYLPYTVASGSKFQATVFSDQQNFYNSLFPTEGDNAYSRTNYTSSFSTAPVITSFSPGASFTGRSRGTSTSTIVNTSADDIKIWGLDASNGYQPIVTGSYPAGGLLGEKTVGQHGLVSVEWTDKLGRTVCKTVDSNVGTTPYLNTTYYLYNYLSELVYVIPPKAVDLIAANGWSVDPWVVSYLCFYYEYNAFKQITGRNIPSQTGVQFTVYDQHHRPVLSQTPLLYQQGKWAFSIYDSRDRVRFKGYVTSTNTQSDWQSFLDQSILYSTSIDFPFYLYNGFNGAYPAPTSLTNCDIVEYLYYDDYSFESGSPLIGRNYDNSFTSYFSSGTTALPAQPYSFVQGLITGKKTKVIDGNTTTTNLWIYDVNFYDTKGRVIQTQTLNPWNTSNWDVNTVQYQFTGEPLINVVQHYAWSGATKASTKVVKKMTYNVSTGRLSSVRMATDNESYDHYLFSYTYDDFGKVTQKQLGGGAEIQNYSYNIRGQLTGINIPYLSADIADQHFGANLSYDYGFSSPRYDGAISGFVWRGTAPKDQAYGYNYDAAGRMTGADYVETPISVGGMPVASGIWDNTTSDYTVSNVKYDPNGNILSMKQRGVGLVGSALQPVDMDDLTYTYFSNSNKLAKVADAATVNYQLQDFVDGTNTNNDYGYDADGNLKLDRNKGVTDISYNVQDLPLNVTTASNGNIDNVYDADGTLIEKTITFPTGSGVGTNPWVYRYSGPFVYRNDSLLYMLHDEGRARWMHDSLKFKYDFFVKDHLGNVRAVVTSDVSDNAGDYLATHELASACLENLVFANINEVRDPRPYFSSGNLSCARLNGNNDSTRIGTSLLLHVMAGDKFNLNCQAYYDTTEFSDPDVHADAMSMMGSLISTLGSGVGGFGLPGSESGPGGIGPGNSNILEQLFNADNYANVYDQIKETATNASLPRAYLNYISFNEQMQIIPEKSGAIQVDASTLGHWGSIGVPDDITVDQNGFLAVYISDEQYSYVHFDNVHVLHYRGRLLDEQHYYPFGMTIRAGSNDPVANRYLYQGKELQDEVGLQLYDFHARQYDPQIGRFWGIDPADQFPSGYTGMGNDPGNNIDPDGMQTVQHEAPLEDHNRAPDQDDVNFFTHIKSGGSGSILDDGRFNGHGYNDNMWLGGQGRAVTVYLNVGAGAYYGSYTSPEGNSFGVGVAMDGTISASIPEVVLHEKSNETIAREAAIAEAYGPSHDEGLMLVTFGVIAAPAALFVGAEIGATAAGAWAMDNLILSGGKFAQKSLISGGADLTYQLATRKIGDVNIASIAGNTFLGPLPSAAISYSANINLNLNFQFNNPLTVKGITSIGVGTLTNYGANRACNYIGVPKINAGSFSTPELLRASSVLGTRVLGNFASSRLNR